MATIIDKLPDPDIVGESLYRAVHEELIAWFRSMPEQDQTEVAESFTADLREIATNIDNAIKE